MEIFETFIIIVIRITRVTYARTVCSFVTAVCTSVGLTTAIRIILNHYASFCLLFYKHFETSSRAIIGGISDYERVRAPQTSGPAYRGRLVIGPLIRRHGLYTRSYYDNTTCTLYLSSRIICNCCNAYWSTVGWRRFTTDIILIPLLPPLTFGE